MSFTGFIIDNFAPLVGIIFMILFLIANTSIDKKRRRIFVMAAILSLIELIVSYIDYQLGLLPDFNFLRQVCSITGYIIRPLLIYVLITLYLAEDELPKIKVIMFLPALFNAFVYFTAFFSPITFSYDGNTFVRGPLGYTMHIIVVIYYVIALIAVVKNSLRRSKFENVIVFALMVLCLASLIVETLIDNDNYGRIAIVYAIIFYYMYFQSSEYHKEMAKQSRKLEDMQVEVLVSQIGPHFIFNALSTIKYLYAKDKNLGDETMDEFADYLRGNINSISNDKMISFKTELKHVRNYLAIEKKRFDDRLNIVYDIKELDFMVPSLILQPLVENAVKHGVCRKDEGGTVTISAKKKGDEYIITVADDGAGFDVNSLKNIDGTHVGFRNVKNRIETLGHGKIEVQSEIGKGTTVTVRFIDTHGITI